MPFGAEPVEPLLGGDVSDGVARVGDTVRRPPSAASDLVRTVLHHLESAGFDGAPRWLGTDALGRDVLSFGEGEVAGRPWPDWVADPSRAASVARLARRLDDAMEPFGVPAGLPATLEPHERGDVAPRDRAELVGHFDITPENVVFRDGRAAALLDFDLARPGTRVEEVVGLLLWWAGWMAPEDREPALADVDPASRGRLLVDAYGLDASRRGDVLRVAIATAQRTWHSMRWRSGHLGGGWRRMWDAGVGDRIRRREAWLREHHEALDRAIRACGSPISARRRRPSGARRRSGCPAGRRGARRSSR